MSARLPTDDEIRARAEELQLIEPGADLPPAMRAQLAKQLLEEASRPQLAPALQPDPVLLSRSTHPAPGGVLRVDVLFIPDPQPNPQQEGTS